MVFCVCVVDLVWWCWLDSNVQDDYRGGGYVVVNKGRLWWSWWDVVDWRGTRSKRWMGEVMMCHAHLWQYVLRNRTHSVGQNDMCLMMMRMLGKKLDLLFVRIVIVVESYDYLEINGEEKDVWGERDVLLSAALYQNKMEEIFFVFKKKRRGKCSFATLMRRHGWVMRSGEQCSLMWGWNAGWGHDRTCCLFRRGGGGPPPLFFFLPPTTLQKIETFLVTKRGW